MKKFNDSLSPINGLLSIIAVITSAIVVFRPTFLDFVYFFAVDFVALFFAHAIDRLVFLRLYPDYDLVFPEVRKDKIGKLSPDGKLRLFYALLEFPVRRAAYFTIASFIKVIPAGLVVVFIWKHQTTNLQQAALFVLFEAIYQSFLYGAVYFEAHRLVSETLVAFHRAFDWSDVFKKAEVRTGNKMLVNESLSFISVGFFVFVFQWAAVTFSFEKETPAFKGFLVVFVGIMGLMLAVRVWYLQRSYFFGGLEKLFHTFETLDYRNHKQIIPLHSNALLARFENTFNLLIERLRNQEQMLSQWVIHETEQSRFRALGEISGLVAHDLIGPLQAIQFCADALEKKGNDMDRKYVEQLNLNAERAIGLARSIRGYLKHPGSQRSSACVNDVHGYVVKLLKTQFTEQECDEVTFVLDPSLFSCQVDMAQMDLAHVFYNLFRNSIQNFVDYSVDDPKIEVSLCERSAGKVKLFIHDNGSGLDREYFEKMTAYQFLPANEQDFREGLGLRLVRRLIERNGGSLDVLDKPAGAGTTFCLTLKERIAQPA